MSIQANPFKRTTIIIMFVIGFIAFVALLYGLGMGNHLASGKNGQAHGASNSLVGYQALVDIMRDTGKNVQYSRTAGGFDNPGLLVLTPAPDTNADDIAKVIKERAFIGPTIIILPKWRVAPLSGPTARKGWVQRFETLDPALGEEVLKNIADIKIKVPKNIAKVEPDQRPLLHSTIGGSVKLPAAPVTISSDYIHAIVPGLNGDDALIGYLDRGFSEGNFPLVLVADADLLNNSGMANRQTAKHALALMDAVSTGPDFRITFDLTFNGLGNSQNLLTLVFKPPFLSATICLIIAALAAAWAAFNRFGPPVREQRSINFGKTALVNNSAGLIHRMRREHLVTHPYVEFIRTDAIHALGLTDIDREDQDHKLDMLGEVDGQRFTSLFNSLTSAHDSYEIARRAAALHHWKKELIG
ncbi:hypothetical protein AB1K62_08650 [Parasphingorhabdus sp. JC815]|uniref:hypothetical protein n=1 Tax=Parasphingorhabdus sp. JC815 TaxID=3232140 RepID=UPI00345AC8F1